MKEIDTKGAYQYKPGTEDHTKTREAAVSPISITAPPVSTIAKIPATPVVKNKRSILETIRYIMEVLTPWMVAFLFGKTVYDLVKSYLWKRRKATGV